LDPFFGFGGCCFETGSYYVAQAGLKLKIFLPQPPKCWDYRHTLTQLYSKIFEWKKKKRRALRHSLYQRQHYTVPDLSFLYHYSSGDSEEIKKYSTRQPSFSFLFFYYIIVVLGVHCDIYKSSYKHHN
jgi:hypothetical protein